MAEDATRRLLKLFGVAVTEAEDALAALERAAGGSGAGEATRSAAEAFDRAARDLDARWGEVGRLIQAYHARARAALLAGVRARGDA